MKNQFKTWGGDEGAESEEEMESFGQQGFQRGGQFYGGGGFSTSIAAPRFLNYKKQTKIYED